MCEEAGLHFILVGLAVVPWAHSDLWTWERAVLGFAHLPFQIIPGKGRHDAHVPMSWLLEKCFCNLLELVFPSNAGNILISPVPPMAPWSGG